MKGVEVAHTLMVRCVKTHKTSLSQCICFIFTSYTRYQQPFAFWILRLRERGKIYQRHKFNLYVHWKKQTIYAQYFTLNNIKKEKKILRAFNFCTCSLHVLWYLSLLLWYFTKNIHLTEQSLPKSYSKMQKHPSSTSKLKN